MLKWNCEGNRRGDKRKRKKGRRDEIANKQAKENGSYEEMKKKKKTSTGQNGK